MKNNDKLITAMDNAKRSNKVFALSDKVSTLWNVKRYSSVSRTRWAHTWAEVYLAASEVLRDAKG
jgi:hypothetical protein